MELGFTAIPAIVAICYVVGMILKAIPNIKNDLIPIGCMVTGAVLGVLGMNVIGDFPATDIMNAMGYGIISGFASTGINQLIQKVGTLTAKK